MQHQDSEANLFMKSTGMLPSTVRDGCLSEWSFSSWIHIFTLLKHRWQGSERIMLGRLFDFEVRVTHMPSRHINIMCKMFPPKWDHRWPGFLKLDRKKKEHHLHLLCQHIPCYTVLKVTRTWWRYVNTSTGKANSALHLSSVTSLQFAAGLYLAYLCVWSRSAKHPADRPGWVHFSPGTLSFYHLKLMISLLLFF